MAARRLTEAIPVAAQTSAAEVAAIHAEGFRAITCNRPDGEGIDQPALAGIAAAARAGGIAVRHIPVAGGMVRGEDARLVDQTPVELPGPGATGPARTTHRRRRGGLLTRLAPPAPRQPPARQVS